MKPATVIEALKAGTATQDQVDWARRRLAVLDENERVFGPLSPEEEDEAYALTVALNGWPF